MQRRERCILVIDEGTTSTKAFVFDREWRIVAQDGIDLALYADKENFVEQDAKEIFEKSVRAARNALKKAGLTGEDVACIGITAQRGCGVAWDKATGEPIGRLISWQDTRTVPIGAQIARDGWAERLEDHMILPGGSLILLELCWLIKNDPAVRSKYERGELMFGGIDTWLIYKLTGGKKYVTSSSCVSMFHGYDFRRHCWDGEYLDYLGISPAMLPEVMDDMGDMGITERNIFEAEIPITGNMADQQSATFAHRVLRPGMMKCTCGTGAFVDLCVGERFHPAPAGLFPIATYRHGDKGVFQVEGCIKTAGAIFKWLRDDVRLIADYDEIEAEASKVSSSGGVMFVPALTGLGAPYWDETSSAVLSGLSRSSTKAHILRAALEGVAFRIRELCECMQSTFDTQLSVMRMDGGLSASDSFCQIVSDVTGVRVERAQQKEATAMGAAEAAGLYAGLCTEAEADALAQRCDSFLPDKERGASLNELYEDWRSLLAGTARKI